MKKQYYVYILTNKNKSVLYTGVTSNLERRIFEHKEQFVDGFTKRYDTDKLVYYEICESIEGAIEREKQIKAGSRRNKIELIENFNSDWHDLFSDL